MKLLELILGIGGIVLLLAGFITDNETYKSQGILYLLFFVTWQKIDGKGE
jgi:hypothetical protein